MLQAFAVVGAVVLGQPASARDVQIGSGDDPPGVIGDRKLGLDGYAADIVEKSQMASQADSLRPPQSSSARRSMGSPRCLGRMAALSSGIVHRCAERRLWPPAPACRQPPSRKRESGGAGGGGVTQSGA